MLYIETVFSGQDDPMPVMTGILNGGEFSVVNLWRQDAPLLWREVKERINGIRDIITMNPEAPVSVNDFKSHIDSFGLPPQWRYNAFCRPSQLYKHEENLDATVEATLRKAAEEGLQSWQRLLANAHRAYAHIEKRGFTNGIEGHPIGYARYSTNTFSGRSSTSGFTIQTKPSGSTIFPQNEYHKFMIQFDWASAEPRMASILSADHDMQACFFGGKDIYSVVGERLGIGDRTEAKKAFIAPMYALNTDAPSMRIFPKFREWMLDRVEHIRRNGWAESILGRRFNVGNDGGQDRSESSVFNAMLQGSVAHAMHAVLPRIVEAFPENVMAEVHDSVIMSCPSEDVQKIVDGVSRIMIRPFEGVPGFSVASNPIFPVKISLGRSWRVFEPLMRVEE